MEMIGEGWKKYLSPIIDMKIEKDNIYLGDCKELIRELTDKSIDLIIMDPPYLFQKGGYGHSEIAKRKGDSKNELSQISNGFDLSILDECIRVLKKINIYIWCSKMQLPLLFKYFENKEINFDLLCWHKTNPIPTQNNIYLQDTEFCFFAREKGVPLYGDYHTRKKYWVTAINQKEKNYMGIRQ